MGKTSHVLGWHWTGIAPHYLKLENDFWDVYFSASESTLFLWCLMLVFFTKIDGRHLKKADATPGLLVVKLGEKAFPIGGWGMLKCFLPLCLHPRKSSIASVFFSFVWLCFCCPWIWIQVSEEGLQAVDRALILLLYNVVIQRQDSVPTESSGDLWNLGTRILF